MTAGANDATRAPHLAGERQAQASDPGHSTWLTANAGAGKTKVLIDRVSRLLLAGTDPGRILCLTYTKAAAGEMQNRLFDRLGEWAMLPERDLRARLAELGGGVPGGVPGGVDLGRARSLFARAIDTPGGLKIQTIHSFCAGLLRRFPLEAGISPGFRELDDPEARLMRASVVEAMADGADVAAVDALTDLIEDGSLAKLVGEVVAKADCFAPGLTLADFEEALGLAPGFRAGREVFGLLAAGGADILDALPPILDMSGTRSVTAAARIRAMDLRRGEERTLERLEQLLLTGSGAKEPFSPNDFPVKAVRGQMHPDDRDALDALKEAVAAARPLRLAAVAARRSHALYRFGTAFLTRYRSAKAALGALDFDDLVRRTAALLDDPSVSAWVLYRLDGGIDHILVDEAQDTSPAQWRVIERLTDDFAAGTGARAVRRTLFVVGDKKQSIYSFQGADVREFDAAQGRFSTRFREVGQTLRVMPLEHSFRSSEAILRAVDMTFSDPRDAAIGGASAHVAFFDDLHGRVDLWDPMPATAKPDEPDYDDPAAITVEPSAVTRLAQAVARQIALILQSGTPVREKTSRRAVHAGDVLVLVQRRGPIHGEILRACKALGLPVAGSDRLKLSEELAVQDMLSLLSFLSLPEDDLALAEVLRSPLFGWGERALFRLAHGRPEGLPLWAVLRGRADQHPGEVAVLRDLLDSVDFLRPFELIGRALTRHGMRRRLIARLGPEAEDGLDELVSRAIGYERSEVPSLTGFVTWMQTEDSEVRRQTEAGSRAIRVMTAHGAKGLEAPIVILPDCVPRRANRQDQIVRGRRGRPLWRGGKDGRPPALAEAVAAADEAWAGELRRLLYVAMTRAASWLIVCTAGDGGADGDGEAEPGDEAQAASWYAQVALGMARAGAVRCAPDDPALPGRVRLDHGDWSAVPGSGHGGGDTPASAGTGSALPEWALVPPAPADRTDLPVLPSSLPGPKTLPGEPDGEAPDARASGTALHRLLEVLPNLPPGERALAGQAVIAGLDAPLAEGEAEALIAEAERLIAMPGLAWLWAGGLAEAAVSARLPDDVPALGGRLVTGAVDRLILSADRVLAVDFKSNRVVPDRVGAAPLGLLRQMAAYHAVLEAAFPGRRAEVAFLWTRTGDYMPIPPDIVRDVLQSTPIP
jgi:ATP-dependent helicase/nuclease subunit A